MMKRSKNGLIGSGLAMDADAPGHDKGIVRASLARVEGDGAVPEHGDDVRIIHFEGEGEKDDLERA